MPLEFDTRPAAYAVIVREEEILLAYWVENGQEGWTMPGGGLDLAEHPVDATVREVFEETGYHAEVDQMLGVDVAYWPEERRHDGEQRPLQSVRMLFAAHITGGELTAELNGTTTHAVWIPLADVESLNRVSLVDIAIRLWREQPATGKLLAQTAAENSGK
ncbi:phosphohydrolase, MutT/nudix family [Renibacterium salmoninarum ATCC 33209]|uniref:Phosphohydrolase, MutT/nudix family n=1 Tax=Renibacterium salmoninarum (strain ATCC 33209 / DSM 20767 / JCM 11484 / NBRC 15589 / NCIMB 2235) TaxID=288705 RepID=A9WPC2_RENSM|nr:NUDIX domain-containing protein [Renibacterium salmoninarum]ABY22879.1 phosphohydrolase, MutT/nudix family [Renibacterium salmoninarum ATCC 33209]